MKEDELNAVCGKSAEHFRQAYLQTRFLFSVCNCVCFVFMGWLPVCVCVLAVLLSVCLFVSFVPEYFANAKTDIT